MFVVFKTRKKGHFWNVKIATKGWRMTGAPSPGILKSLTCFLAVSGISRVFAHCCSWNVRVSSLWRRAGHETENSNMAGHCERYCENCREMTAYFGTRPEIKGLASQQLSFAQWYLDIRRKEERLKNIEMKTTQFPKCKPDVKLTARGR